MHVHVRDPETERSGMVNGTSALVVPDLFPVTGALWAGTTVTFYSLMTEILRQGGPNYRLHIMQRLCSKAPRTQTALRFQLANYPTSGGPAKHMYHGERDISHIAAVGVHSLKGTRCSWHAGGQHLLGACMVVNIF